MRVSIKKILKWGVQACKTEFEKSLNFLYKSFLNFLYKVFFPIYSYGSFEFILYKSMLWFSNLLQKLIRKTDIFSSRQSGSFNVFTVNLNKYILYKDRT